MTLNQSTKKKNIFQHQWIPSDLAESRQRFFCSSLPLVSWDIVSGSTKSADVFFNEKSFFYSPISLGFRFFFRQLLEVRYVETESYGGCCRCSRWWPHPSSCVLIVLRHPAKDRTGSQTSPFAVKWSVQNNWGILVVWVGMVLVTDKILQETVQGNSTNRDPTSQCCLFFVVACLFYDTVDGRSPAPPQIYKIL